MNSVDQLLATRGRESEPFRNRPTQAIALDCEGPPGGGRGVGEVAVVNSRLECIYRAWVEPCDKNFHGYPRENCVDFAEAQKRVRELLEGRVLVGYGVRCDLSILGLDHPRDRTWDALTEAAIHKAMTDKVGPHGLGTKTLKQTAEKLLNVEIQRHKSHDPVEGAAAVMKLYQSFWLPPFQGLQPGEPTAEVALAVDCMGDPRGTILRRTAMVNARLQLVFYGDVRPVAPAGSSRDFRVCDYAGRDFTDAFRYLLQGRLLVGYEVRHDLRTLRLDHSGKVWDASDSESIHEALLQKTGQRFTRPTLKWLSAALLDDDIQYNKRHDPVEDATAAMKLYLSLTGTGRKMYQRPQPRRPLI